MKLTMPEATQLERYKNLSMVWFLGSGAPSKDTRAQITMEKSSILAEIIRPNVGTAPWLFAFQYKV